MPIESQAYHVDSELQTLAIAASATKHTLYGLLRQPTCVQLEIPVALDYVLRAQTRYWAHVQLQGCHLETVRGTMVGLIQMI